MLDQTIAAGKLNFAVAAVGIRQDRPVHAAGYRDAENQARELNNIIQIASMTKLVTTIAALQLMEQDARSRHPYLATHLNSINCKSSKASGGRHPDFEKAKRAPTARELMTHTAGYVYEFWNANALKEVNSV